MTKTKVAILGTGNIGTDLMIKIGRSKTLELVTVVGIDPTSEGLHQAKELGYTCIDNGLDGFMEDKTFQDVEVIFDATSAKAHIYHAEQLEGMNKQILDLTPAAVGPFVIPAVNMEEHLDKDNINLVTCGGQATIPIVHAVSQVCPIEYAEIVSTISSVSAGPGTRENIDEFTQTTAFAIENIGKAKKGKAIILLNPAEPPILMRNTVYVEVQDGMMKEKEVIQSIEDKVAYVQQYVPGYKMTSKPIVEDNIVTVLLEIEGAGDYLPAYSGNLDIMTASAVKVAEELAQSKAEI